MKRYTAAFDYLNRVPDNSNSTKLMKALSAFEDIGNSIDSALGTLGDLMFWATSGSGNGDNTIACDESLDTIWSMGQLLQLLMEFKEFCEQNEVNIECSIKDSNRYAKMHIDS